MRKSLFFGLQRLIGSKCSAYYKEFIKLEGQPVSELESLRKCRLRKLLNHAAEHIPYYRNRISTRANFDLDSFPVLTKQDIRDHFKELMSQRLRSEYENRNTRLLRYGWIQVKTGGSTGIPTTVIHDANFRDVGRAGRLYCQYLCGFPFGTPYFRLWGSMKEINRMQNSPAQRIMSMLAGEDLMNAFRMSPQRMEEYIKHINSQQSVDHMMAYVDAAYHLALFAKKYGIRVRPIKSIMACGGTVTDDIRTTLNDVFKARVHNSYGARDCPAIACECQKGGIHIFTNHVLLEVVDHRYKRLPSDQTGRILVTLLSNYAFPLIRYEIGDVGALSSESCECGRPFPLLKKVEGRTAEFLISTEGGYISPVYIRHLIGVVHNPGFIKRFQLVQQNKKEFFLRLEIEPNVNKEQLNQEKQDINSDLKAVLGTGAILSIKEVNRIEETESGKFLYTINKSGLT